MSHRFSRRVFLQHLSSCIASAAVARALKPAFVLAQAAPSSIKNVVEVFCYGGYDARHLYPYFDGSVGQIIRDLRPGIGIKPESVLRVAAMNQRGRLNPIGFHPAFKELLATVSETSAGVSLIDQFGVTKNFSNSHEVAQKQFRNGLSSALGNVSQGYMGRLLDATQLPGLAVWGFGLSEPSYMLSNGQNRAMMVSSLSSLSLVDRNFGTFNCSGVQGATCTGSGDWSTTSWDDSAFARSVIRQLYRQPTEEMPLQDAVSGALNGAFQLIPVAQKINSRAVDILKFRPDTFTYTPGFATTMSEIAKTIDYLNSPEADSALQASTKIMSVGLSGWDSHSSQVSNLDSSIAILGAGLRGLIYHLYAWNKLKDTVVVVYSEFGRTTRQNGSSGTDHGLAGTAMVLGGAELVSNAVVGPDPDEGEALDSKNTFTPQVAVTGVLRQIYGRAGLTTAQLDQVFPERLPGEMALPFLV